jgi:pimeloyl-ACP methyl ester carboxylesterase
MIKTGFVLLSTAAFALAAGCWRPPKMQRAELERGYILVLEGIDFNVWQMAGTYQGLRDAGIDCAIDLPDWGYRNVFNSGNRNLTDLANNRRLCEQYARQIADYRRQYPGRPVDIVGYSGGGALAVMTAERLPAGVVLDRIVLLGAAISPDYDLTTALNRCERGIVNFYSSADSLVLGAGTKLYGTIDRKKTVSAGHVGFKHSPSAASSGGGDGNHTTSSQPATDAGLTQVAWTPSMWLLGHDGGHFGWVARRWTADVVAPYLKQPRNVSGPREAKP